MQRLIAFLVVVLSLAVHAASSDFEAGVARVKITPPQPFWMSGYASRSHPSEGVLQDLWAKALALRDRRGHQVVIVTTDLIGMPKELSDEVARRAHRQFKLDRDEILFNCSHTHSGPAVGRNLQVMFDLDAADQARVQAYYEELANRLVTVVGEALARRAPATLASGQGSAAFAVNRREPTPNGVRIGVNSNGPTDPAVPVLKVTGLDGKLLAVLFGYACHNTTLGGDRYLINGDYAGFAQAHIEQAFPEATALFMILCGGDQNPNPRGTVELAQKYGGALGEEVIRVLAQELPALHPPIRTDYRAARLELAPHTRAQFEAETKDASPFRQRRARLMLADYDRGQPVRQLECPVQAVAIGADWALVGLGGEVVVDYALRLKADYPGRTLVVAGYCNDVRCYIPSRRVLKEGGYEPVDSMIYYGLPGPFAETVEETLIMDAHRSLKRVGFRKP